MRARWAALVGCLEAEGFASRSSSRSESLTWLTTTNETETVSLEKGWRLVDVPSVTESSALASIIEDGACNIVGNCTNTTEFYNSIAKKCVPRAAKGYECGFYADEVRNQVCDPKLVCKAPDPVAFPEKATCLVPGDDDCGLCLCGKCKNGFCDQSCLKDHHGEQCVKLNVTIALKVELTIEEEVADEQEGLEAQSMAEASHTADARACSPCTVRSGRARRKAYNTAYKQAYDTARRQAAAIAQNQAQQTAVREGKDAAAKAADDAAKKALTEKQRLLAEKADAARANDTDALEKLNATGLDAEPLPVSANETAEPKFVAPMHLVESQPGVKKTTLARALRLPKSQKPKETLHLPVEHPTAAQAIQEHAAEEAKAEELRMAAEHLGKAKL